MFDVNGTEEELLCDIGAAALLLDERWLVREALQAGPSLAMLFYTSALFATSLQATAWQLAPLLPWPCAFIFWEPGFRKADSHNGFMELLPGLEGVGRLAPKWRVKSRYPAPAFPSFIPVNQSTDDDTVCACSELNEIVNGNGHFPFGQSLQSFYTESRYVPYYRGGNLCKRIVSFLTPVLQRPVHQFGTIAYQSELL